MSLPEPYQVDEEIYSDEDFESPTPDQIKDELEVQNNEFKERVEKLVSMMKEDSDVQLRILAETYVYLAGMDQAVQTVMMSGGPGGMLKAMLFGRKKKEEDK